jgi:predicted transposase/invertase (TIGR01784 family)
MPKYINPYTDFGFKRLFGEEASKDLLIDFLNTFLPEKHRIKVLNFRNTEQLGPIALDRKAVFDIFCEAESGEKFIVEMQKAKQHFFKDRALFCTAFPIREQAEKGEDWLFELQALYFVGVLDFKYDEKEERQKFLRDVMLKDQDGDIFYDKLRFIFLQMPLFTKSESELETHQDKWFYFLKNLTSFEDIPAILREPVFERAFAKAEVARMDDQEYQRYYADRMAYLTNNAAFHTAQFEGVEIGRAEGRAEGRVEEKIEIARNMMADGVDPKIIAKYTSLPPEEIERLG